MNWVFVLSIFFTHHQLLFVCLSFGLDANVCEKTTFISHPFIKKYVLLVGPGDLPAPSVVVVPTVAGHC